MKEIQGKIAQELSVIDTYKNSINYEAIQKEPEPGPADLDPQTKCTKNDNLLTIIKLPQQPDLPITLRPPLAGHKLAQR